MFGTGDEGGGIVIRDLRVVVEKTVNYQHHCSAVTCLAFSTTRYGNGISAAFFYVYIRERKSNP